VVLGVEAGRDAVEVREGLGGKHRHQPTGSDALPSQALEVRTDRSIEIAGVKAVQRHEHDGLLTSLRREHLARVARLKEPGEADKAADSNPAIRRGMRWAHLRERVARVPSG
jgi:hypothetical protein